jgi:hypothetical protein
MILELGFNIVLTVFFIYCFFYVGTIAPEPVPGQMDGAQWPQMILGLLVILFIVNIAKIIKNKDTRKKEVLEFSIKGIITNKLFIGSVLLIIYSLAISRTGFVVTSFVFFMIYSYLLGEKRILRLIITSVLSVAVLYFVFNRTLDIMLPRGNGIFRTFAMFLESL